MTTARMTMVGPSSQIVRGSKRRPRAGPPAPSPPPALRRRSSRRPPRPEPEVPAAGAWESTSVESAIVSLRPRSSVVGLRLLDRVVDRRGHVVDRLVHGLVPAQGGVDV